MTPVVVAAADWRRQQWRDLSPIPVPVDELWGHHSGSGSKTFRTLLGNERYHVRSLGWRALGYSWAIVASRIDRGFARVFEGRGWGAAGAHTSGRNRVSHGVLLVGGWQSAADVEVEACARSLAWLAREGARRGATVEVVSGGHREAPGQSTSCPSAAGLRVVRRAQLILAADPQPDPDPEPTADIEEDDMVRLWRGTDPQGDHGWWLVRFGPTAGGALGSYARVRGSYLDTWRDRADRDDVPDVRGSGGEAQPTWFDGLERVGS